ncbi:ecto-ADP-ribosyltransferase 5-like [Denticeps clupeoides]|uniref:ecto-ADP-ribosyltransferase 5-like n=1 Tax=Denticeps clupeoides TaxID=299321 RepID=UPI0010A2D874|nr:ecto-ADP-ribosyltransferase 5-like [Denticeps clupeoides]
MMKCIGFKSVFLMAIILDYRVTCRFHNMDMSINAVDDRFSGCREKMHKKVMNENGLLQKELEGNIDFQTAWRQTTAKYQEMEEKKRKSHTCSIVPGGKPEHTQALMTYILGGQKFRLMFNEAVQTKGGDVTVYKEQFQFKSFHFLLRDAMQILKNISESKTVYRYSTKQFTATKGTEVRFGRFTAAFNQRGAAEENCDNDGTLFTITSSSVVNLEKYACLLETFENLISPDEVFIVEEVKKSTECDKEIVLKHSMFHSYHNCYFFQGSSATKWLSSSLFVLLAAFLSTSLLY